ncbi:GNAT family N-acetyltransferase [Rhodococcus sp. NPDC059968]|uniref:GNAT family N-acetyltransferase n=1 Tax=Rhodococcus sp. NPDC059968 TaxID=3347017 RepID=UPI00366A78E7
MTLSDASATVPIVTADPDLDAVVDTLVTAFRDDPIIEWAIPPNTLGRDYHLAAFFASTTEFLLDHGGIVAAPHDYSAVLVWSPPGEPAITDAENRAFLDRLTASTGTCGARVRTLMEALDAHHPADLPPHCHVMFAAVRPEHRGTGVRAALTGALRAMRLHDGIGVYAEASSTRNLRLWERLGGQRIGAEITLPEGGPSLYPIFFGPPPESVDAP